MWWTITGNFGTILPIDWSKSYARKLHMPALNLNENKGRWSSPIAHKISGEPPPTNIDFEGPHLSSDKYHFRMSRAHPLGENDADDANPTDSLCVGLLVGKHPIKAAVILSVARRGISPNEKFPSDDDLLDLSSEDEAVASDLDMHSLILSGLHQDQEPVKTADEVIREIDDMMQVHLHSVSF
uniref:Uncharacterized protein n=1 Tax=Timema monikensis TaxID=170555 RepID=A0A7R9DZ03_9NEOP|nr:unnamed protein product [Timema monikensis]